MYNNYSLVCCLTKGMILRKVGPHNLLPFAQPKKPLLELLVCLGITILDFRDMTSEIGLTATSA